MISERLDKVIASQGEYSRKEIKKIAKDGAVEVNNKIITDSSTNVNVHLDTITIFGKELIFKKYIYIMMNKPKGVLSAASDKKATTVIDLVPQTLSRKNLFPAGRLDRDTTGFVLITDDGDFAHKILSPKNHVFKTYEALLREKITQDDIEYFARGIVLADGTQCQPAELEVLENGRVKIKICEGKFHQIKRMISACDNEVLELRRTEMGELKLDETLEEGECREMTDKEVERISNAR